MPTSNPADLADGDVVVEDWVDAVAQHVLRVYSSTASRDADLTDPHVGQKVYIASNDAAEGWYSYNSAGEWRPLDWSSKWGLQGSIVTIDSDSSPGTSASDITDATVTWDALANRRYKVKLIIPRIIKNTGAGEMTIFMTNPSNVETGLGNRWFEYVDTANSTTSARLDVIQTGLSTGSVTRKFRGQTTASTMTVQGASYNGWLAVYDDGPTGPPV